MKYITLLLVAALFSCADPDSQPKTAAGPDIAAAPVEYRFGDTVLKGYLAYDKNITGARPGVLVVHEWWGHNEYARMRAEKLAGLGYTALAVDMYGDGTQAHHPDDAGKFAMAVFSNVETARGRFNAGLDLLKAHPTTDPDQTAAIGYCFGGSVVLHMARNGADLDAVASFHGGLQGLGPVQKDGVHAKVLVLNGAADAMVTAEQIDAFKKEMDAAGADYELVNYEGAMHSFTNPIADSMAAKFGLPLKYDRDVDNQSWQAMQDLFNEVFAKAGG